MNRDGVELSVDGGVACVTIRRPEARNALSRATIEAFVDTVHTLAARADLRAVVVTGGDGAFIAGGDLNDLHGLETHSDGAALSDAMQAALSTLSCLTVPVAAAIDGPAIGGGVEVALACDVRFAGPTARIALRQIDLGVTTGWGGARRLLALVGRGRTLDLLWTGATLDAVSAAEVGLVEYVVRAPDTALTAAMRWATMIAERSPLAVSSIKALVSSLDAPQADYEALERAVFAKTWASDEHAEAVRAFVEARARRRAPGLVE
jgi:enoyl-CoA hydratase